MIFNRFKEDNVQTLDLIETVKKVNLNVKSTEFLLFLNDINIELNSLYKNWDTNFNLPSELNEKLIIEYVHKTYLELKRFQ